MKLISWNVNGLRACMNKGFEDFLRASEADAFCLQETKMQREQADFVFNGYEEYWNSAEKKGYSGTAIFSKNAPLTLTSIILSHICSVMFSKTANSDTPALFIRTSTVLNLYWQRETARRTSDSLVMSHLQA